MKFSSFLVLYTSGSSLWCEEREEVPEPESLESSLKISFLQ